MSTKKYVSLDKLSVFLNNLKNTFALKSHNHPVDSALSDTSENPVQNKVVNAEFDAIAEGMGALESAIDDKADAVHDHSDTYYNKEEIHDLELITIEAIDNVCGSTIRSANDVTF